MLFIFNVEAWPYETKEIPSAWREVQQPNYSTSANIIYLKNQVASNFKLNLWSKENWNFVEIWKFLIIKCAIDLVKGSHEIFIFFANLTP
jgi:hypothetical protein